MQDEGPELVKLSPSPDLLVALITVFHTSSDGVVSLTKIQTADFPHHDCSTSGRLNEPQRPYKRVAMVVRHRGDWLNSQILLNMFKT